MQSRVGARIVPLGTTDNGVRDTCVENGAMGYPSDPTDHSILRHRQSRATTAWVPPALGRLRWISLTELPLTAGLQANHDNESWTWEVNNHRLALVLFLWIEQNTQRRLESENKRGVYECVCILERYAARLVRAMAHRVTFKTARHYDSPSYPVGMGSRAKGIQQTRRSSSWVECRHGGNGRTPVEIVGPVMPSRLPSQRRDRSPGPFLPLRFSQRFSGTMTPSGNRLPPVDFTVGLYERSSLTRSANRVSPTQNHPLRTRSSLYPGTTRPVSQPEWTWPAP